jgi:hypothetical protein
MGVSLAMVHSIKSTEPEVATSCSQAGTPMDKDSNLPTKIFYPKCFMSTRNVGDGAETEEMYKQYLVLLEIHPMD